jgi:hypothetical protein
MESGSNSTAKTTGTMAEKKKKIAAEKGEIPNGEYHRLMI